MSQDTFARVLAEIKSHGLSVLGQDLERPWGGHYDLDNTQIDQFVAVYFPQMKLPRPQDRLPMQPKIMMVAPGKRQSWQYHTRRAEEWRIVEGPVGIARSFTDIEPAAQTAETGATARIATGERHRLCGLENWGVVAEIWVHTDATDPSNESDIVRLADDFDRQ